MIKQNLSFGIERERERERDFRQIYKWYIVNLDS